MTFDDAMDESNRRSERVTNLVDELIKFIPFPGQVEQEIAAEKTQKDFDTQKKRWKGKLGRGDTLLADFELKLSEWRPAIRSCETELEKETKQYNAYQAKLRELSEAIRANNKWMKELGMD